MDQHLTRVVLCGVPDANHTGVYETLHEAMEHQGFQRIIQAVDGRWFHLPPGEYLIEGSLSSESVREMASAAARSAWHDYSVMATPAGLIIWQGLRPVSVFEAALARALR